MTLKNQKSKLMIPHHGRDGERFPNKRRRSPLEKQELQVVENQSTNYVPSLSMTPSMANDLIKQLDQLKKEVMRNEIDYDIVPGTQKPSLLKPGAERLLMCFGLGHRVHEVRVVEDWENGFFHYVYKVTIHKSYPTHEIVVAECIGSANSKENRYRDRWVFESDVREMGLNPSDLEKKQFTSKAGKPYSKYKVANPDPYSLVNTLQKMAIKRALVGATLQATGTSEFFTQDMEGTTSRSKTEQPTQSPYPESLQKPQPTEAERKKKGCQMMYTEATNKKLTDEEAKAIIKDETGKTSGNDLTLDELLKMHSFFKNTSSKVLQELAKNLLSPNETIDLSQIIDIDPETGEVINGGAA